MPDEVEVNGTQGEFHLERLRDDCYEAVILLDPGNALLQGIEWRGHNERQRWKWVLGGRELYVLGPCDDLYGFVSVARLWLNARHTVLARASLRERVLAALQRAGCTVPSVTDETIPGVPPGWLLFRDVVPTCAVPMQDGPDIFNALCPAHEIEPHLVGGIKLDRYTWLAGYPPRIRFTGEFANGFEVKIDGRIAGRGSEGGFSAPGWDSEGEHRLWFGDRAETYWIRGMDEHWQQWSAHDFGIGAAICGASIRPGDQARITQVRVPVTNPLLIGAHPGEIFYCSVRKDVRSKYVVGLVPFAPVWALPTDPAHADKIAASILLCHPAEPQIDIQVQAGNCAANRPLRLWIAAIHDAGCKGLRFDPPNEDSKLLWRRYRVLAKGIRRKMR